MREVIYDAEEDILYVRLLDDEVHHSVSLDDLRIIDYTTDNAVVGVEFIGAGGGVDLSDVPFAHQIEQLIGESGHQIRVFA